MPLLSSLLLLLSPFLTPAQEARLPVEEAAARPAPSCPASQEQKRTAASFRQGATGLRQEAELVQKGAAETAELVTRLAREAPRCEPGWGPQIRDAILAEDDSIRLNLIQRIHEVGKRTAETTRRMAASVDGAGTQYEKLNLCEVNACAGSFQALGSLFNPVAVQAKGSLGTIAQLKLRYVSPATKILAERERDIEWVLSGAACRNQLAVYRAARAKWREVEQRIAGLERKIARENQVAGTVAKSAVTQASCKLADLN